MRGSYRQLCAFEIKFLFFGNLKDDRTDDESYWGARTITLTLLVIHCTGHHFVEGERHHVRCIGRKWAWWWVRWIRDRNATIVWLKNPHRWWWHNTMSISSAIIISNSMNVIKLHVLSYACRCLRLLWSSFVTTTTTTTSTTTKTSFTLLPLHFSTTDTSTTDRIISQFSRRSLDDGRYF
jgi:hypothetical protein